MKTLLCNLLILFLLTGSLSGESIAGDWRTIDDRTGKAKSIIRIAENADGEYEGQVIEILHSDRGPNPLCEDCKGERKNKPIIGMVILWGLKHDGEDIYKGGEILDPENGKIYQAKLKLRGDGNLEVRGFIGFSLIGRSQVWEPIGED